MASLLILSVIILFSVVVLPYPIQEKANATPLSNNFHPEAGKSADPPSDEWPMLYHDARHTGYSTSSAPKTNSTVWVFKTAGAIRSSPAVVDGRVFVGSMDGKLYCINGSTGELVWSYSTSGSIESSPAVANGMVVINSDDFNIYCINETTGTRIWSITTESTTTSPTIDNSTAYVRANIPGNTYTLYLINISTGEIYDRMFRGWGSTITNVYVPAIDNGKIFVGGYDGGWGLGCYRGGNLWITAQNFVFGKFSSSRGWQSVCCVN